MKRIVWITTQFPAFHKWDNAPDVVRFLRSPHRHLFHVKIGVEVTHNDRDVEFFMLKQEVEEFIEENYWGKSNVGSCEMIAERLLTHFEAAFCEVSEDGENGARLEQGPILPALRKRRKAFIGIEAEGPYKGLKTLFIPGSYDQVSRALSKGVEEGVEQVYYGAGNDREISPDIIKHIEGVCIESGLKFMVEIEQDDADDFAETLHEGVLEAVMLASSYHSLSSFRKGVDYVKVTENGLLVWYSRKAQCWQTRIDDPLFAQDRYI